MENNDTSIRDAALEEAACAAGRHKGSAARERMDAGTKANTEIVTEERGEDIAAELIAKSIRALQSRPIPQTMPCPTDGGPTLTETIDAVRKIIRSETDTPSDFTRGFDQAREEADEIADRLRFIAAEAAKYWAPKNNEGLESIELEGIGVFTSPDFLTRAANCIDRLTHPSSLTQPAQCPTDAALREAAVKWLRARDAMCASKVSDPNWRALLNDLSNTENALAGIVRHPIIKCPTCGASNHVPTLAVGGDPKCHACGMSLGMMT